MLTGKTIILGVTGGIAAYKAANLASLLKKQHADVHVIMTKNAMEFITPLTFETLTVNKCLTDTPRPSAPYPPEAAPCTPDRCQPSQPPPLRPLSGRPSA